MSTYVGIIDYTETKNLWEKGPNLVKIIAGAKVKAHLLP